MSAFYSQHLELALTMAFEAHGSIFLKSFTTDLKEILWHQLSVHETLSVRWNHQILAVRRCEIDGFVAAADDLRPTS